MNKPQKLFFFSTLIVVTSLFIYLVRSNEKKSPLFVTGNTSVTNEIEKDSQSREMIQVGDPAPSFTTTDLDGNDVHLSDYKNQVVILNFWATWCPPCRHEMPIFQTIHEQYQEQGVVVLALNINESADQIRSFFYDQFQFTFTPLHDWNAQISIRYGAFNLPTTIVIGPDQTIIAIHRGPITLEQLETYLAAVVEP